MNILLTVTSLMVVLAVMEVGTALEVNSLTQEMENVYPHIVEYIDDFTINTNDLEKVLSDQLHTIKLGDIKTSYAHVTNTTVSISHYESEKRVE
jgi:flagellar biosynthesis component FlhA